MSKLLMLALLVTALTLPIASCTHGPGQSSHEDLDSDPFQMVTAYRPEDCRSAGSPSKLIASGRAVDVDGDGVADLVRRGRSMLVRSAAYPSLGADRPWIRVSSTSEDTSDSRILDLVKESALGPDLVFLLPGEQGVIPQVQSFIDAGDGSPQRIVSGFAAPGASPNTKLSWTQEPDGSLKTIRVAHEDLTVSAGVSSESYDLQAGKLEVPPAPTADEVMDAGELSAAALLESAPEWGGDCRNDDDFLPASTMDCYRQAVGDATAASWMAARGNRSWTNPDECQ